MRMRTKRTSNNVRPVELPPLFHRGTRTPNIERRHDGLNFIFDVGSSEFDVRCFRSSRPSSRVTRHSQKGVALIITLILLSVVTFMAITFLALSRRERSAVTTVTDTASARLAADAALANAEAQVIANVLATTNPYNFTLLVSTNYINPFGFQPNIVNPTNVNYDYLAAGGALNQNQFLQNLENLYYSPRPPVFIANSTNSSLPPDFRYYLDLNRNGRFDTNGVVGEFDNNNIFLGTSFHVGDPEWIGVLERPDAPYGPNNKFIARYAFIAVPVGNALDLNAIHNQTFDPIANRVLNPPIAGDVFLRNQGVGSWEINLAAFLADLNTNVWLPTLPPNNTYYGYYQPASPNQGRAFEDARALLAWRYANNYISLVNVSALYGAPGQAAFRNNIDGYSDGPLMITLSGTNDYFQDVTLPWAGADNTNHFFTHQELFDPTKTQTGVISPTLGFSDHLKQASTNVSTYDRYTFYRLLSQLGTDTTPESGKMNLNYRNVTNGFVVPNLETNFYPWTAIEFFTNAADRLLRAYTTQWRNSNPTNFATTFYSVTDFNFVNSDQWTNYPAFGITNIPVWVNNLFVYSPAVNRLLQLAANIYDATTNNFGVNGNNYNYPSVFRPTFWVTNENGYTDVYINGYQPVVPVSGTGDSQLSLPLDVTQLVPGVNYNLFGVNVYGVPWIIGAKKGFPNFNKFTMQDVVQITRKLQIRRSTIPTTSISDFMYTNQLYIFSISNSIGIDCWNSYSNSYPNQVQIVVNYTNSMMLTNDAGTTVAKSYSINTNITLLNSSWPGSAWNTAVYKSLPAVNSFIIPINTTVQFLTNSVFYSGTMPPGVKGFYPVTDNLGWETNKNDFTFPNFGLLTTNRLQVFMLDGIGPLYHVIDYVQFAGPNSSRNLNAEFQTSVSASGYGYLWSTYLNGNVPWGIINQIDVSDGNVALDTTYWNDGSAPDEISGFRDFMGYGTANGSSIAQFYATNYIVQVPYSPTVTASEYISWQANDPLVHYLASDLNFHGTESSGPTTGINVSTRSSSLLRPSFNLVNDRYQPWGRNSQMAVTANVDPNPANLAFKDPLVRSSDNWDFPTNKFPTIGWVGRVHRGTPWQSVYLKASNLLHETNNSGNIGTNTWVQWTGDTNLIYGQYFDAANSAPVQDRLLFDLFTTAFNDNATRGTLSVNQGAGSSDPSSSLAAWSALFSGLVAISNNAPDLFRHGLVPQFQNPPPSNSVVIIQPAGVYNPALPLAQQPALAQIVQGISQTRTNTNLFPLQTFTHVGDILSVPQLTEQSPFLHWWNNSPQQPDLFQQTNGISDEMYEWLPQQAMSLLRCSRSPRYVIYCYGQALKPAPNSIYTGGGQFFGMVTNYQVVSEIATRAVVRFGSTVTNNVVLDVNNNWVGQPVVTNNNAVIESFNLLPPD